MGSVLLLLEEISEADVSHMIREYEAMPKNEYRLASAHARTAAATLRKPTWMLWANCHVNSLLLGLRKLRYEETYSVMRLIAAVEIYSFAVIGQAGLDYFEYNLAIGPVAGILAPDMFASEQGWNIERVEQADFTKPYRPASYRGSMGRKIVAAAPEMIDPERILARAASRALTVAKRERQSKPRVATSEPTSQDLLAIMGLRDS